MFLKRTLYSIENDSSCVLPLHFRLKRHYCPTDTASHKKTVTFHDECLPVKRLKSRTTTAAISRKWTKSLNRWGVSNPASHKMKSITAITYNMFFSKTGGCNTTNGGLSCLFMSVSDKTGSSKKTVKVKCTSITKQYPFRPTGLPLQEFR